MLCSALSPLASHSDLPLPNPFSGPVFLSPLPTLPQRELDYFLLPSLFQCCFLNFSSLLLTGSPSPAPLSAAATEVEGGTLAPGLTSVIKDPICTADLE